VATEASRRARQANAEILGQRWFSAGSRAEAMEFIQDLLRPARSRVLIADPYLGTLQLGQFLYAVPPKQVQVTLLTTRLAFNPFEKDETKLTMLTSFQKNLEQLKEHHKLLPRVLVISDKQLHDRFLVVDDDVWFVGNSLSSLGEKASMIVRLPNPDPVIAQLQSLISAGQELDRYIRKVNRDSSPSGRP
jgi:phosphatidylserine/phosphatidylglycerophosphate/cardiolipin synthase-like enzyme